jgi:hypothetical protein
MQENGRKQVLVAQPASMRGRADLMTLWAGQSVGLCHHAEPAELMTELIAALEDIRKSEVEELGKQSETASRYAGTNPH